MVGGFNLKAVNGRQGYIVPPASCGHSTDIAIMHSRWLPSGEGDDNQDDY